MTLETILLNLYRRLNLADSPDAAVTTRLTMFVNQRYREIVTQPGMARLRDGFGTVTTEAGLAEYTLPAGIERLRGVRDRSNDRVLDVMSFETWRSMWPDEINNTGTPTHYVPIGLRAVTRRPAGEPVWAVSSFAGDNTQTITINASYSQDTLAAPSGLVQSTTVALNGTTRVSLAFGNGLDDIFDLSLSAVTFGYVELYDAAVSGNLLLRMFSGQRQSRLFAYALYPTPSAAITLDLDYEHNVLELENSWSEPRLPTDFHDLLIWGALCDEYMHRDDTRLAQTEAQYQRRLSELKVFLYGHRSALKRIPPTEIAPLGSWYPRQTW